MIQLWGRRNSSNVQKVAWALAELDLPYERRNVGGSFGGTGSPDYLAMNPNRVVPTLRDGTLTLFESDAILRYLASRYGAGSLLPDDAGDVARADQWTTWNTTTLYPAVGPLFFATIRTPRAEQDVSRLGPAAEKLAETISRLDAALEGREWLVSDRFTFGDIGCAISARRAFLLPFGAPDRGRLPNLSAWLARVEARPAFREHVDLPMGSCLEEWNEHERAQA